MKELIQKIKAINSSIFSVNLEVWHRMFGYKMGIEYHNKVISSLFFYSIIIFLKNHLDFFTLDFLNFFTLILIFFCIVAIMLIFFFYKDDSEKYKDTPLFKLLLLSLLFHVICLAPLILLALTSPHHW